MNLLAKSLAAVTLIGLSSCSTMSTVFSPFGKSDGQVATGTKSQKDPAKETAADKSKKDKQVAATKASQEKANLKNSDAKKEPGFFSMARYFPPSLPIVKVRPDQLKEIKSGKDKALAYQNSRRGLFSSFFGKPVDFKEPELPSGAIDNPEFGLLPPKPQ